MALNGPLYADLLLRNGSLMPMLYTLLAVYAERCVSEKIAMWKHDVKRKEHVLCRDWILNYLSDFCICNNSQCFMTMKITSCC